MSQENFEIYQKQLMNGIIIIAYMMTSLVSSICFLFSLETQICFQKDLPEI